MANLTDDQKVLRNSTGLLIRAALLTIAEKLAAPLGLNITGAQPGQVPVIQTVDANGTPTSYAPGSGSSGNALPLAGGTMSGNIDMDSNRVQNLPTPSANGDAAPKGYVDNRLNSYRTESAQNTIDEAQYAQIDARAKADQLAIVAVGGYPAQAVEPGQYVIVRGASIGTVADGLYIAVNTLSPSTAVTAADLTAVSGGGLNQLRASSAQFADNQSHIDSLFDIPSGIVSIRINQLDSDTIGVPSAIASDLAANPWQLQGGWQSNGYYKGLMYTPWNTPQLSIPVIGTRLLLVWCDISKWEFSTLDGSTVWSS